MWVRTRVSPVVHKIPEKMGFKRKRGVFLLINFGVCS